MIETPITTGEYQWNNITGGSMIYNILTKTFSFQSGIGQERQEFVLPSEDKIKSDVIEYIKSLNGSLVRIDQENISIKYLQLNGSEQIPETDTGNAYMAQVDLHQIPLEVDPFTFTTDKPTTIESLPVYYELKEHTNQTFLVKAGGRQNLQYISGMYKNHVVDTSEYSAYPLKTSEQAYEDLKNGNAYILSTNADPNVIIAEMKLGYFIPESAPEYIMPIFIFTGKDFNAYVHGIADTFQPTQNR
jgi:Ni/Co efflux regulator RcnB